MSTEPKAFVPSSEDLARWIELSGESEFVDAKAPITWDGADASACLAKDIAAFANSRDGGVIVIGKSENGDGSFSLVGISAEQASAFDTTKIGQWVNARFSQPIRQTCHQAEYDGRRFVLIVVEEFNDIPSLYIKSFQATGKANIQRPF